MGESTGRGQVLPASVLRKKSSEASRMQGTHRLAAERLRSSMLGPEKGRVPQAQSLSCAPQTIQRAAGSKRRVNSVPLSISRQGCWANAFTASESNSASWRGRHRWEGKPVW